jgi:glucose/arabinose dehydrogenase
MRLRLALLAALSALAAAATAGAQVQLPDGFADEPVAGALDLPVGLTFLPDGRLLVVEQNSARIRMLVGSTGSTVSVGTVPGVSIGGERGLLGIAVDPRWPESPYLYVHSTQTGSHIAVSRFTAAGDLAGTAGGAFTIDPSTRYDLVNDIPDNASNHNGGTVRFGLDGMLYVSLGEDATPCAAQDTTSLRGKILRLDVMRLPAGAGSAPRALVAAAGSPFAASPDSNARLVWAFGLRNPFRFQVDRSTGDLWIGDVGQSAREELDVVPSGGLDFGWPFREGPTDLVSSCSGIVRPTLTEPVFSYDRTSFGNAAIISAGRYRAPPSAARPFPAGYEGDVFASDFYAGHLWHLVPSGVQWVIAPPAPGQAAGDYWGDGFANVSDYAIGPDGSIYYARMDVGQIRRIVAGAGTSTPPPTPLPNVVLRAAFPTPAKDAVRLDFALSYAARVSIHVHDLRGRQVRDLMPASLLAAGSYTPIWDGRDDDRRPVESGLYFARLDAGNEKHEWRIVITR